MIKANSLPHRGLESNLQIPLLTVCSQPLWMLAERLLGVRRCCGL